MHKKLAVSLMALAIFTVSENSTRMAIAKNEVAFGERFGDRGDYLIDMQTGLLWQKDGSDSGKLNFYQAAAYATQLKLGEMTGWRVPTRAELASIFPATITPFTNTHYNEQACCGGPNEFPSYWTSELDPRLDDYAWIYVWYSSGGANNGTASKNFVYVRCVRDPITK